MDNAALEPLTHLADSIGDDNVSLYIGDQIGASDDKLLRQHKIINVLNCAVNCDINYVDETLDLTPGGSNRVFGFAPVRTAKIGMIDGDGNDPILMFAAVHLFSHTSHHKNLASLQSISHNRLKSLFSQPRQEYFIPHLFLASHHKLHVLFLF